MPKQSLFERLMAVNPAEIDLSEIPALDPNTETKIGELDEFERRLVVVRGELGEKMKEAIEAYKDAMLVHLRYHIENPEAKHGGPLCEELHAARKVGDEIDGEMTEIASILSSVIRIRFPEHANADLGVRSDGSIARKLSAESDFVSMLANALEGSGVRTDLRG